MKKNMLLTNTSKVILTTVLAVGGFANAAMAQSAPDERNDDKEIIVTAQKREARLSDVPLPVAAVGGEDLLLQNQTKAQDFFSTVPGVNLQFQNNRSQLAIRGISTGPVSGNPVVGYTIDDAPFGASTGQGGLFGSAPDLDPSELARVEVLRGPQGSLYGASSIGGLVKYVTVDPDTSEFSGSIAGGLSLTHQSDDIGYNLRGSLNIPVSDTFAIRASAFTREEAGYIDNVRTGEDDVNSSRITGGRLSMMWKPVDSFSLKLGAIYQERTIFGASNVDTTTGSFYQQTDNIGSGRSESQSEMYTAEIRADLGGVDLTSISSFSRAKNTDTLDFTASPLVTAAPIFPILFPGITPIADLFRQGYNVDKLSHETRLTGSFGANIDWLVGGFYTNEDANYSLDNYATDPANGAVLGVPIDDGTGPQLGTIIVWRDTIKYEEYAAFGNVTLRFSDQFDVQLGGRYSHNEQSMNHNDWFQGDPYPALPFYTNNRPTASGSAFTYEISPRYRPNDDLMMYARVASGYRPGGTNAICGDFGLDDPVPCQFKPDRTVNYELGAKGDLLNSALSFDVSLFRIDWDEIQIVQVLDVFTYNGNAGVARSTGVELSLTARPTDGLEVSAWWSFVDATLKEEFIDANFYAEKGDRLPFSSKHSGRLSIAYSAPVSDTADVTLGASSTYVGARRGEFVPFAGVADQRALYPSYVQFDLNAGANIGQWNINVFVQNLTNKRGVIGGGFWNQTSFNEDWFNYTQPRTIGMNLGLKF